MRGEIPPYNIISPDVSGSFTILGIHNHQRRPTLRWQTASDKILPTCDTIQRVSSTLTQSTLGTYISSVLEHRPTIVRYLPLRLAPLSPLGITVMPSDLYPNAWPQSAWKIGVSDLQGRVILYVAATFNHAE